MVDQKTGDVIVWESKSAVHTQVTRSLIDKPAWAATEFHQYGGYVIPAKTFYDALESFEAEGWFDEPEIPRPKILK